MTCHNLRNEKGFNLIELMIVVAIIGILASVAVPAYISHFRKARQVEGTHRLMDIKTAQEKFYAMNDAYASDIASLSRLVNFDSGDTSMFLFTITHPTDPQTDFLAQSSNDINEDGARTDCWQITDTSEPTQVIAGACTADGEGVNFSLVNF